MLFRVCDNKVLTLESMATRTFYNVSFLLAITELEKNIPHIEYTELIELKSKITECSNRNKKYFKIITELV